MAWPRPTTLTTVWPSPFARHHPVMAKDFRHYTHPVHPKPGEFWEWGGVGGIRIFCLMTQDGEHGHGGKPGPATEGTVSHCLKRLRHELEKGEIRSLALPKLATGVGGSTGVVRPLIQQHLGDLKTPDIRLHHLPQGRPGDRARA